MPVKKTTEKKDEVKFSKEALLTSNRFIHKQDLVSAVLEDGKKYTIREAEDRIQTYMKGKVK